jgi:hypothetical protein
VRAYLTTWLWYRDRLCCLSSKWLLSLSLLCLAGVAADAAALHQFLDDLTFLLVDNELKSALVLVELMLLASGGLWLLACCLGTLARRAILRLRGP